MYFGTPDKIHLKLLTINEKKDNPMRGAPGLKNTIGKVNKI